MPGEQELYESLRQLRDGTVSVDRRQVIHVVNSEVIDRRQALHRSHSRTHTDHTGHVRP